MTIRDLQKKVVAFCEKREWKKFHNPKDLALSMTLESSEVLEYFQWQNGEEVEKFAIKNKEKIAEELADVFKYLLLMGNSLGVDLEKETLRKLKKDGIKYPIKKIRGTHTNKHMS